MSHDASDSWFGLLSASRLFAKLEKNAVANRLVPARSTSLYPEAAAALRAIPPNLPSPNSPPLHSDFVQFAVWYSSLFPAASRPTPTEIQTAWRERCLAVPSSSVPDISKSETFLKNFNGHESHFTSVESVVELTSDSASDSPETLADSQALHNTSLSKETQTHEEKPFDNYVFKDPILSKKTTVRVDQIIQKSTDVIIARDFQEWLDINNLSHSSKLRDAIGPIADLQKSFANHLTFEKELGILTKERIRLILESADKDSRLKKAMKKISSIESNSVVSGALDNMERAIESALRDWPMAVKDYKYDIFISYRVKSEAQLANELFLYLQLGKHKGRVFLDQHLLQDGEDWRKGFLDGLKQSKIVVMLVSAAAIEGMKRSNIWLDNLLLEWETGLLASTHGKKCTILPVFIGQKNGNHFDFNALKKDLKAKIYPKDRPGIDESVQCYLSASKTLSMLLESSGVLLKGRSELKSLITCISQQIDQFEKEDQSSFTKAKILFESLPTDDTKWDSLICKFRNFSENDYCMFCLEVLPYNENWTEIVFEGRNFNSESLSILKKCIDYANRANVWKTKTWKIKNSTFTKSTTEMFFNALANTEIESLTFEQDGMRVEEILEGIGEVTSLRTLELVTDKFTSDGIRIITELLDYDPNFVNLSLSGEIENADANALINCLKENSKFLKLTLNLNSIGDVGCAAVKGMLSENTTLQSLKISGNNIGTSGASEIFEALEDNSVLRCLDLSNNRILSDFGACLSDSLGRNTTLKIINLRGNSIGIDAISLLCSCLEKNNSLEELVLENNFGNGSGNYLGKLLKSNKNLLVLGLENMNFSTEDIKLIAMGLKINRTLLKLDFEKNKLNDESMKEIADALKTNSTLTHLFLAGTREVPGSITVVGATFLAEALESNVSLETITLGSNNINSESASVIVKAIRKTQKISAIDALLVSAENDGSTFLHTAAELNSTHMVKILLDRGEDMYAKNSQNDNPLHFACQKGSIECVKILLDYFSELEVNNYEKVAEKSPLIESKGDEGKTPLIHTICGQSERSLDIINLLLDQKVNMEASDKEGNRALHHACKIGNLEMVKLLVSHGAATEAKGNKGIRPLHVSIVNGHYNIADYLVNKKDVQIEATFEKMTPAMLAVKNDAQDIFKMLCQKGANLDAMFKGETPRGIAISNGNLEMCKLFDDSLLNTIVDKNKNTAICHAALHRKWDIVDYYLEKGVNIDLKNSSGYALLHYFCNLSPADVEEVVEETEIKEKNDPEPENICTREILADDPKELEVPLTKSMIELSDETPKAPTATYLRLIKKICAGGVNLEIKCNVGSTPLILATSNDNYEIAEILLAHGADVNAKNNVGNTPLLCASPNGSLRLVKLLLEHNANATEKNSLGYTAVDMARRNIPVRKHFIDLNLINDEENQIVDLVAAGFEISYVKSETWFHRMLKQNDVVIVDYTASWCPPSKYIAPIFEQLAVENPSIKFLKVDVDEMQDLSEWAEIAAMPTFICYKDGEKIEEVRGANEEQLTEMIKRYSSDEEKREGNVSELEDDDDNDDNDDNVLEENTEKEESDQEIIEENERIEE